MVTGFGVCSYAVCKMTGRCMYVNGQCSLWSVHYVVIVCTITTTVLVYARAVSCYLLFMSNNNMTYLVVIVEDMWNVLGVYQGVVKYGYLRLPGVYRKTCSTDRVSMHEHVDQTQSYTGESTMDNSLINVRNPQLFEHSWFKLWTDSCWHANNSAAVHLVDLWYRRVLWNTCSLVGATWSATMTPTQRTLALT